MTHSLAHFSQKWSLDVFAKDSSTVINVLKFMYLISVFDQRSKQVFKKIKL